MTTGAGKYDDVATYVRLHTQAEGVVVMVINGTHGEGFEVQASAPVLLKLPSMLRTMADGIENDLRRIADGDDTLKKAHDPH